jgi:hypothetical protein
MVSVNESFNQLIDAICVLFLFICVFKVYIDLLVCILLVIDTTQMLCFTPLSMSRHSDVRAVLNHV